MTADVVGKTRHRKKLHSAAAGFHNISAGRIIPEFFPETIFMHGSAGREIARKRKIAIV